MCHTLDAARCVCVRASTVPQVVTHNSIERGEWDYLLCRKLIYVLQALETPAKQRRFVASEGFRAMSHRRPGFFLGWPERFTISRFRRGGGDDQPPSPLCLAATRPLGAWYRWYIDTTNTTRPTRTGVAYNDIYGVSAARVRRWPRATYEALLNQTIACGDRAAEVDHYLERAVRPMYADGPDRNGPEVECPLVARNRTLSPFSLIG